MSICEQASNYALGLDVIVVNYRTPEDLEGFLASLDRFPPKVPFTVTVVDVDPKNTLVAPFVLDQWSFVSASTICTEINVGYARAVNQAASRGRSEVLAIFNADVELTAHALQDCYDALRSHSEWGVLGPLQTNGEGKITHAGIFGTNKQPKHRDWQRRVQPEHRDVQSAVTVSGSAYFIKRTVWDELHCCLYYKNKYPEAEGAFLPTQHYYEETWCSYHARDHGYEVVYYGPVEIIHKWHQASPVGGEADKQMPISRKMFREMCYYHNIECD